MSYRKGLTVDKGVLGITINIKFISLKMKKNKNPEKCLGKAEITHASFAQWKILVVFNTLNSCRTAVEGK